VGAKLQGGPKEKINYNWTLQFYTEHPKRNCGNAIGFRNAAGDELLEIGATPAVTGDETTWLRGGLHCQPKTVKDPLA
jgi:hypothetical protein